MGKHKTRERLCDNCKKPRIPHITSQLWYAPWYGTPDNLVLMPSTQHPEFAEEITIGGVTYTPAQPTITYYGEGDDERSEDDRVTILFYTFYSNGTVEYNLGSGIVAGHKA